MISDFRKIPETRRIDSDVCVIGAGAAGITIAKRLSNLNLRITLLESGGLEIDPETQALYKGKSVGLDYFPLDATRLRYFGGTTNHWAGYCSPISELPFQHRPWVTHSGWPIHKSDLDKYYVAAQKLCELGPYRYAPNEWKDDAYHLIGHLSEGKLVNKLWQLTPTIPLSFGKRYLAELERSKNIQILLNANAADISTDTNCRVVKYIHISTLDQKHTARIYAKVFVLACGGLEYPRLLLASNKTCPTCLGNQNDLVGRFFMEHPEAQLGQFVVLKSSRTLASYHRTTVIRGTHLRAALASSGSAQRTYETGKFAVFLSASGTYMPVGYAEFRDLIRDLKSESGDADENQDDNLQHHLWSILNDLPGLAQGVYYRLRRLRLPMPENLETIPVGTKIRLTGSIEQSPNPNSRVTLDSEIGPLGLPRIKLDWQLTDLDRHTIKVAAQLLGEEIGRLGLGRVRIPTELVDGDDLPVVGQHHHMGTTRMSDTPTRGVVDENCRVHGMSNLYVAGSSVFPTGGVSNRTLTLIALAIRLSDHIDAQLSSLSGAS